MKKQIETRYAVFNPDNEASGIGRISLVKAPAIEDFFVRLSKQSKGSDELFMKFESVDMERGVVLGLAMKADMPIYRKMENSKGEIEEFNLVFTEDVVRQCSEDFMRRMLNKNINVEHQDNNVNGVYVIESWMVEDSKKDKTALYGLKANKGDWAVSMKVENPEIKESIKKGDIKGFSIEGLFASVPVKAAKALSEDEEKLNKIKKLLENV